MLKRPSYLVNTPVFYDPDQRRAARLSVLTIVLAIIIWVIIALFLYSILVFSRNTSNEIKWTGFGVGSFAKSEDFLSVSQLPILATLFGSQTSSSIGSNGLVSAASS
ncbi:MAG TPA: hypothetical protein VKA94_01360, partial [Hyphomicrobiales bacterium]|nr:hypothetical protein [Hyphomicrobiales bacterium]